MQREEAKEKLEELRRDFNKRAEELEKIINKPKKAWCDYKDIDPKKFYGLDIEYKPYCEGNGKYCLVRCNGYVFARKIGHFKSITKELFDNNGKYLFYTYKIKTFNTEKELLLWMAGVRKIESNFNRAFSIQEIGSSPMLKDHVYVDIEE